MWSEGQGGRKHPGVHFGSITQREWVALTPSGPPYFTLRNSVVSFKYIKALKKKKKVRGFMTSYSCVLEARASLRAVWQCLGLESLNWFAARITVDRTA